MQDGKKTYNVSTDSQPMMASEPAATYSAMPAQDQIVLPVPQGVDAEPLREKVTAYYDTLLRDYLLEQSFDNHYHMWIMETGPLSNPYAIADNDHFRAIVKLGKPVVPFILKKMKQDQSLIYLALEQIYKERLLPPQPVADNKYMYSWNPAENIRLWIERLS